MVEPEALDEVQRKASEQFSRQSRQYGRGHILEDVTDVVDALEFIRLPGAARVLDVATGGGHTGLHLAGQGHDVTLADISQGMLDRAAELATERGLRVSVRRHPAEAMPYAAGSFDMVTCRVAPHHFSSPAAFVKEVARVLRPGGSFLLIDGSVPEGDAEAEAWLHEVERLRDPSHVRLLPPSVWRSLCKEAGLRVERDWLWPKKQPDLEWYFRAANTPPGNQAAVRGLIRTAPASVRAQFRLGEEEGKVVWWWPMLTLIASRPGG